MTGYQRFAAYVYEYRKGKKGQNCGFIKVEVKEGRCVLEIHLRCQGILPDTTCKVYGFVRRDGLLMGLPLGSLSTKEDGLEGCIETEAANMGGSDISIGKIGGMIILTDSGGFYGTEWDDQIIRPANFQEMRPMEKTKEEGEKKKEKVIGQRTEEKREEKDMGDPQEVMERTEEENGEGQGGQEEMREPGSLEASGEGLGQYEKAQKEEEPEDVMQGEEAQGEKPGMPEGKVQKEEVQKEEEQKEEVQEVGISTEKAGEEVLKEEEPREGEAGAREEAQKEEGEMAMEAQDMEERRPPQPSEPEDRLSSPESLPPGPEDRPLSPENRPSPESLPPGPENRPPSPGNRPSPESLPPGPEDRPLSPGNPPSPENLPPGPEDRPLSPGNRPSPESLPPGPEDRPPSPGNPPSRENRPSGRPAGPGSRPARPGGSRPPGVPCTPFPDSDFPWCSKLQPRDLPRILPRQRGLLNNRFLQYGFHNFGHILLCRRPDGQYLLGVPGVYDQQEGFMARMFGFPYFKESPLIQVPRGRGGYWYRLMDSPDFH